MYTQDQITKTVEFRYLKANIANLSKFLAYEASDDISIERVRLCSRPDSRYGVDTLRLDFIAFSEEGSKLELYVAGLDKKVRDKKNNLVSAMYYGYYINSKAASDFATYGLKGDSRTLLPLVDKILDSLGKLPDIGTLISAVEWDVHTAIMNNFQEFTPIIDRNREIELIFHKSKGDFDV